MKLTNGYVLTYTEALVEEILSNEKLKFPAKVNYIIQRNYKKLLEVALDVAAARLKGCEEYCTSKEDGKYMFEDADKLQKANEELSGLLLIEQDINILTFDIDAIEDMMLTNKQMEVLMLMIDGEE